MSWKPHNFRVPERSRLSNAITTQELKPGAEISLYVDCLWSMDWELTKDQDVSSLVLPSGCVNLLVFTHARHLALVSGPKTKARPFVMSGKGQIIGARFRPGGFFPFYGKSVSELTDQAPTFEQVFGQLGALIVGKLASTDNVTEKFELLSELLHQCLNKRWAKDFERVSKIFDCLATMDHVGKIADMFTGVRASERSQQRLFERMVGMTPKAVLRTHRFQTVLNCLLDRGQVVNWTELAAATGYYDQAHFINDFREITGRSPTEFWPYNEKMSGFSNTGYGDAATLDGSTNAT